MRTARRLGPDGPHCTRACGQVELPSGPLYLRESCRTDYRGPFSSWCGRSKFLVYSHGGSWCYDTVAADTSATWNCAVRAGVYEGSSALNPPSGPPRDNMDKGIMSSDCGLNPHFCNHSVVYFMYCDGSSFTGDRALPHSPSSPFRVSACAARTLNATGQSRVTLSLRWEHLRAACG